jgi:small subunit ribosomal protein S16
MGRKKRPVYAVVAADTRSPRDGRFIEDLGRYEPLNEPALVKLDNERILYWLATGAQPSDTVRSILSKHGLMLALHMKRKGASDEDIRAAVERHRTVRIEKDSGSGKMTSEDRRIAALREEEKKADKKAAELAKARAEAEAKAIADAEKAQRAAAAERERAAAEAKVEQEASNVAQAAADAPEEAPAEARAVAKSPEEAPAEARAVAKSTEEAPAEARAVAKATEEAPAEAEAVAEATEEAPDSDSKEDEKKSDA